MTREELFKKVGERIRDERVKNGFTLIEFADKIEMEYNNLIRIEKGRTNPTLGTIHKICQALNVKIIDVTDVER